MKTKIVTLLEIAIVLCSLFLVTLPAIAGERTAQEVSASTITTASEDDYVLGIYGNANEDDTIDMRDLTYVKLIFFGKKPETELADAKYDGKINPLDFIQIKLIIVGKEKELTIVDSADRIVTVKKPVKKIAMSDTATAETIRSLKATDKVVAVSVASTNMIIFFPELCKLPGIADHYNLDYEKIYELKPDIFIIYPPSKRSLPKFQEIVDKLESAGIKVIALNFIMPATCTKNTKILGYILDRKEKAKEFIDWREGVMSTIKERAEEIPEKDKPRVFLECYRDYATYSATSPFNQHIIKAGGINIATDMPGYAKVDPEWVMEQNPDIIIRLTSDRVSSCGYDEDDPTEMEALRDSIMNRPELAKVPAVKTGRVYVVTWELFETTRFFVGTGYFAKWFHPELFKDLDPKAIHQEYLTRFQGLDYDLDKHGVFVYPPLES